MAREKTVEAALLTPIPTRPGQTPMVLSNWAPRGADSTEHRENVNQSAQIGIELCRRGLWKGGLAQLAMVEANKGGGQAIPGLALSYLGYGVASVEGRIRDGIRYCRAGVDREIWQPEAHFNLARTYLLAGRLKSAIEALDYAIGLDPDNLEMLELRVSLGMRRQPTFFFLDRGHPLNRITGRLRHRLSTSRMQRAWSVSQRSEPREEPNEAARETGATAPPARRAPAPRHRQPAGR
jgi:hypothetical protein